MSEWIKWDGGECPVDGDVRVDTKWEDGAILSNDTASDWAWGMGGGIIAYRLSEQKSANALGTQVSGGHYLGFEIQPVEFINANNLDFLQGSVIKYISRHKLKGKQADVEKAIHFCKLIIELQYESASS